MFQTLSEWPILYTDSAGGEGGEGRIGMGNTCNSMADSCQCVTKPTEML